MEQLLGQLTDAEKVLIILVLGWFVKQWWEDKVFKSRANDDTVTKLTLAVNSLEVKVEQLNRFLEIIPKLKSDIDAAHEKLRDGYPKSPS